MSGTVSLHESQLLPALDPAASDAEHCWFKGLP